jgi:hypothetical protein
VELFSEKYANLTNQSRGLCGIKKIILYFFRNFIIK